jgi:hypothetical protein
MTRRELAILVLFLAALSLALAVWSWRMSSATYPRNVPAREDHLPEYQGPKSNVMPPP